VNTKTLHVYSPSDMKSTTQNIKKKTATCLSTLQLPWFTTRCMQRMLARYLAVVILSVCLLYACFVTKPNNALGIFWYHTKGQSLEFSATNSGWWVTPPSFWNLRSKWHNPLW